MEHIWKRQAASKLMALLVLIFCMLGMDALFVAPIQAHPQARLDTTGYSIALTVDSTDLQYGAVTNMSAVMSFPASNPPTSLSLAYSFHIGDQAFGSYITSFTSTTVSYMLIAGPPLPLPGQYNTTATYVDPSSGTTVTSNVVIINVEKANPQFNCYTEHLVSPGQTLTITLQVSGGPTVDWSNASATITFTGPSTYTISDLRPDGTGKFSLAAPTQVGFYQVECDFDGSNYYGPSSSNLPLLVSEENALGNVQLYSQPTTLPVGTTTPFTLYVVFHAAPGLPTPSGGEVSFQFGHATTSAQTLGADSTLLVQIYPEQALAPGGVAVHYEGDPYYNAAAVSFPATNPPIPTSGGGNPPTQPKATATPRPKATATPRATATATASSSALASGASTNPPSVTAPTPHAAPSLLALFTPLSWSNGALWLAALIVLLALGSGAGTFILLGRRDTPALATAAPGDAPTLPMQPPSADDAPPTSQPEADG